MERREEEEEREKNGQIMRVTKKEKRKLFIVTWKVTYLQVLCTLVGVFGSKAFEFSGWKRWM